MSVPRQREIWLVRLDPTSGHEQAGTRPAIIVSRDEVNRSGWSLCFGVPLSTRDRGSPLHIEIMPPEGGVRAASFALVDQMRALDRSRLVKRLGTVEEETQRRIAGMVLRIIVPR